MAAAGGMSGFGYPQRAQQNGWTHPFGPRLLGHNAQVHNLQTQCKIQGQEQMSLGHSQLAPYSSYAACVGPGETLQHRLWFDIVILQWGSSHDLVLKPPPC